MEPTVAPALPVKRAAMFKGESPRKMLTESLLFQMVFPVLELNTTLDSDSAQVAVMVTSRPVCGASDSACLLQDSSSAARAQTLKTILFLIALYFYFSFYNDT